MKRFFLALVCASMVSDVAHAASQRMYVHWTIGPIGAERGADSRLKIDNPAVVNDSPDALPICLARGYSRQHCRSVTAGFTPGDKESCRCAVVYSRPAKTGWSWQQYPGPASACRHWIEVTWQQFEPGAKVQEIAEYCFTPPTS